MWPTNLAKLAGICAFSHLHQCAKHLEENEHDKTEHQHQLLLCQQCLGLRLPNLTNRGVSVLST